MPGTVGKGYKYRVNLYIVQLGRKKSDIKEVRL